MEPTISIAVATHKPYEMPDDGMYLPLHVGAALHPDICPEMQGDDTGDNISQLNPTYCELTGLYWVWRNCASDYKGLVHYRRYLGGTKPGRRRSQEWRNCILHKNEALRLLQEADVILPKRRNYYIETVYSHYAHTFDASQFDQCREILGELEPGYVPAWDRLMESRGAHLFNMFVMRRELFDEYCEWLFPILDELQLRIDSSRYDAFGARYLGRVSERLLDPWVETNSLHIAELPVVSPEPVDWVKKGFSFLAAKFLGKKYGKSF